MLDRAEPGKVFIQVVPSVEDGREITWGASVTEQLGERMDDVRRAIAVGTKAVADSLEGLSGAEGWSVDEVSASFGVTLTAEAGVILSKATAGATFEVNVTFKRQVA